MSDVAPRKDYDVVKRENTGVTTLEDEGKRIITWTEFVINKKDGTKQRHHYQLVQRYNPVNGRVKPSCIKPQLIRIEEGWGERNVDAQKTNPREKEAYMEAENKRLKEENNSSRRNKRLEAHYNKLKAHYNKLKAHYNKLKAHYNKFKARVARIKGDFEAFVARLQGELRRRRSARKGPPATAPAAAPAAAPAPPKKRKRPSTIVDLT